MEESTAKGDGSAGEKERERENSDERASRGSLRGRIAQSGYESKANGASQRQNPSWRPEARDASDTTASTCYSRREAERQACE